MLVNGPQQIMLISPKNIQVKKKNSSFSQNTFYWKNLYALRLIHLKWLQHFLLFLHKYQVNQTNLHRRIHFYHGSKYEMGLHYGHCQAINERLRLYKQESRDKYYNNIFFNNEITCLMIFQHQINRLKKIYLD